MHSSATMWILFAALAGVSFWYATRGRLGSHKVECPSCDLYIHGVRLGGDGAVLCPHCREYASIQDGKLVKTPPDRVARAAVFCAELPQRAVLWPDGCCVCGQPATRQLDVKLVITQDSSFARDLATRAATLGMFKSVDQTRYTLAVPHCGAHGDGAALAMAHEPDQLNLGIAFRSYPYYKQYVQLNHVTPRRDSLWGPAAE